MDIEGTGSGSSADSDSLRKRLDSWWISRAISYFLLTIFLLPFPNIGFTKNLILSEGEPFVDLSRWKQAGPWYNGDWILFDTDGDGVKEQVIQTNSGSFVTFFISPDRIGAGMEFRGCFTTNGFDDDYMGFVFGFQDEKNYFVFQWKQQDQYFGDDIGFGEAGITLLKIRNVDPVLQTPAMRLLWRAVDDAGVTVLARWTTKNGGKGWNKGEVYTFILSLYESALQVVIQQSDEIVVYDSGIILPDEPVDGRYGFYNLS